MTDNNPSIQKAWSATVGSAQLFSDLVFGDGVTPGQARLLNMDTDSLKAVVDRLATKGGEDAKNLHYIINNLVVLLRTAETRASNDAMTGLYNRAAIDDRVAHHIERMRRGVSSHGALVYIDLNKFKQINDTYGHDAGDKAIITAAHAIQNTVRAMDMPARRGGDEFAVLIPDTNDEQTKIAVGRLRDMFEKLSFEWNGQTIPVRASVGYTMIERDEHGHLPAPAQAFDAADKAMYAVKKAAKHHHRSSAPAFAAK